MRPYWPTVAAVLCLACAARTAPATFIGLEVEPSAVVSGALVRVALRIANAGDEAAHSIRIAAEAQGAVAQTARMASLGVGESTNATLELPCPAAPGTYTAVVRTRYTDPNGRRFSAVAPAPFAVDVRELVDSPANGLFTNAVLHDRGTLDLDLAADAGRPATVRVTLALPDELACDGATNTLTLAAGEERRLRFPVRNVAGLPGSRYRVLAVLDSEDAGGHRSAAVEGDVLIAPPWYERLPWRPAGLGAAALLFAAFVALQFRRPAGNPPPAGQPDPLAGLFTAAVLLALFAFPLWHFPLRCLFLDTTSVGGDTPAHNYLASHLREQLFGHGRVVSWAGGWWCGFPMFQYYFTLPYALMALLSLALPLHVAFKLVSVLGTLALPPAAWLTGRMARLPRPAPLLLAIGAVVLLFDRSNTMWGVNVYSTLAGMISNSLGFPIFLLLLAALLRDTDEGRWRVATVLLLAATIASHFFTSVMAGLCAAALPLLRPRAGFWRAARVVALTGLLGGLLMAWWLVPLEAKRDFAVDFGENWPLTAASVPPFLPWIAPFAAVGLIAGLRRGQRFAALAGFMLAASLFLFRYGYDRVSPVFVNVRLWPFMLYAALALAAVGLGALLERRRAHALAVAALLLAALCAGIGRPDDTREWAEFDYRGLERTAGYPVFRDLVLPLRGTPGRLANDLHDANNALGSSRIFECVPALIGKPILEGGLVNSAAGAFYSYFVQGETSQSTAGFPTLVKPASFDMERGTRHLELFNVKHFIARWEGTQQALAASPAWRRLRRSGDWELYELTANSGRYVTIPRFQPIAVRTARWKEQSLEWLYTFPAVDRPVVFLPPDAPAAAPFGAPLTEAQFGEWLRWLAGSGPGAPAGTPVTAGDDAVLEESVSDGRIAFRTRAVGAPHLIKCTYFPNWKVRGAARVYMVSPCFMLVYPEREDVELYYGSTFADTMGRWLTAAGAVALAAVAWARRRSKRAERGVGG